MKAYIEIVGLNSIESLRRTAIDPSVQNGGDSLTVCVCSSVDKVFSLPLWVLEVASIAVL